MGAVGDPNVFTGALKASAATARVRARFEDCVCVADALPKAVPTMTMPTMTMPNKINSRANERRYDCQ